MEEHEEHEETKLNIFNNAVTAFGKEVELLCQKLKSSSKMTNKGGLKEQRLIKGGFVGGKSLYGYSLNEIDPDLVVKAAYNLQVTLNRLVLNMNNKDLAELGVNAEEVQRALMEALNPIIKIKVTDESTAQMAKTCEQLFAQINRVVDRIIKDKGSVTGIIPGDTLRSVIEKLMGGKEEMKIIDEITPLTVQVAETLFDMAERRYRVKELSKKIETFKDGNLPPQNELRQELIKVLPDKFQEAFPPDGLLDKAFFTQYQKKWEAYLVDLNGVKIQTLMPLANKLAISESFLEKRVRFEEISLAFLAKVTELGVQIAPPPPEPVVVEKVSEEKETLPLPTAPVVETPVEALTSEDKELRVLIEECNKTLKEQEDKIQKLDTDLSVLSGELAGFEVELQGSLTRKVHLLEESDELKKSLEQEPTAREEHQKQQTYLATQQESIIKLKADIAGDRLALDWGADKDKDKLAWLGIQDEQDLKNYLDTQKQETDFLEKASSVVSNFFGSFLGGEVKPLVNYEEEKAKFLENLDNTDKRLIADQEEFKKWDQALNQQVSENQKQLETLNRELSSIEKEIEALKLEITQKTATKTEIGERKEKAEGEKKELKEELGKLEEQKLAEEVVKPATFNVSSALRNAGEKLEKKKSAVETAKRDYNNLKQEYKDATGLSDRVSAFLALAKAWFEYQKVKDKLKDAKNDLTSVIKQENKPQSVSTFFPPPPTENKEPLEKPLEPSPTVSPDDATPKTTQ